jgi:hypothetical protein
LKTWSLENIKKALFAEGFFLLESQPAFFAIDLYRWGSRGGIARRYKWLVSESAIFTTWTKDYSPWFIIWYEENI